MISTRRMLSKVTSVVERKVQINVADVEAYEENTGIGACGPVAEILRDAGYGDIVYGQVGPPGDYVKSYPHFWIKDASGNYIDPLRDIGTAPSGEYWDEQILKPNEPPDPQIWNSKDKEYWLSKVVLD